MTHFYFNVADLVHGSNRWPTDHRWEDVSWKVASGIATLYELDENKRKYFCYLLPFPKKNIILDIFDENTHPGAIVAHDDIPPLAIHYFLSSAMFN